MTEDTGRVAPQAPPARLWWILLARAAVAFLLGVLVLLSQKTRPALDNFIGVYWLAGSLLTLRWVAGHRRQPGNRLVWVGPGWLLPAIEGVLLVAIVAGDPGRINRRSRLLRGLSIALVTVLVLGALSSTLLLIDALIHGGPETNSADALLSAGTTVWVSNNLAFALLYWELDSGGAAARAYHLPRHPHFAFPQQQNPALAPPGWRPRFVDYLYLGFTNALAFSPTDVMPLVPWAKVAMALQSFISMGILALVVARAVNIFT